MKKILLFTFIAFLFVSCDKEEFDINNPDVKLFVQQLKNGTYNCYEKGQNGENLWLQMPKFSEKHIQSLIDFAKDTSHVANFPINPISSRMPTPNGRDYFILGECLLWAVEGIRNNNGFGSLDPYLIDMALSDGERPRGITSSQILIVKEIYNDWWSSFKDKDWKNANPLSNTSYAWF
jgi:hypothetical protein